MNQQKIEKLKVLVKKGKWSYVLKHGVFGWGVPTGVLWSVLMHFLDSEPFIERILVALIIFPIFGLFFGLFNWYLINREFNKLEQG